MRRRTGCGRRRRASRPRTSASRPRGGGGRDFFAVEALGDAEARLRERVVVPADGSDDRDVASDEGLRLEPLPTERFDAAGEVGGEQAVTVVAVGPQLVIAGEEKL